MLKRSGWQRDGNLSIVGTVQTSLQERHRFVLAWIDCKLTSILFLLCQVCCAALHASSAYAVALPLPDLLFRAANACQG